MVCKSALQCVLVLHSHLWYIQIIHNVDLVINIKTQYMI